MRGKNEDGAGGVDSLTCCVRLGRSAASNRCRMGSGRVVHDANTCMQLYLRRALSNNTHEKSCGGREFVQVQGKVFNSLRALSQGVHENCDVSARQLTVRAGVWQTKRYGS